MRVPLLLLALVNDSVNAEVRKHAHALTARASTCCVHLQRPSLAAMWS
jgi:hypothetical protein